MSIARALLSETLDLLEQDAAFRERVTMVLESLTDKRPNPPAPGLLDRDGAAKLLGVSTATIDRWSRSEPDFPVRRAGDSPRFIAEELLEWTARKPTGAHPELKRVS